MACAGEELGMVSCLKLYYSFMDTDYLPSYFWGEVIRFLVNLYLIVFHYSHYLILNIRYN